MRYPTLSSAATAEHAALLLAGDEPDPTAHMVVQGTGPELALESLAVLGESLLAEATDLDRSSGRVDRDRFEGSASGRLHALVSDLPIAVLDDPGFWAYLTLVHFWGFVTWREASAFASNDPGRYLRYIDGRSTTECVLTRMALRARICAIGADCSLASAIPFGADFWRSHVLRVAVSGAPAIARAYARQQAENRMATEELREFARTLNRVTTNIVPQLLDDDDALALVNELSQGRA